MIKAQTAVTGGREGREERRKEGRRSVSWRDVVSRICRRRKRRGNTGVACSKQRFCSLQGLCTFQGQTEGDKTLASHFLMYSTLEGSADVTEN